MHLSYTLKMGFNRISFKNVPMTMYQIFSHLDNIKTPYNYHLFLDYYDNFPTAPQNIY